MATFDFDFEAICAGQDNAVQDMLDQIDAAWEEWSLRLAGSLQLNQEWEPGFGNFATAWLDADESHTLPIPDKVRFTWVQPSTGYAGEYMAINGQVTRLENEYYSGKAFLVLNSYGGIISITSNTGPTGGSMDQAVVRPAHFLSRAQIGAGQNTGGAFAADNFQVNAQFGLAPVTNTPVGITYAFAMAAGTAPFFKAAFFQYVVEALAAGDYDLRMETYSGTGASYLFGNGGWIGGVQIPIDTASPSKNWVEARIYGEVIYGSDI